jgi:hypothetical protein
MYAKIWPKSVEWKYKIVLTGKNKRKIMSVERKQYERLIKKDSFKKLPFNIFWRPQGDSNPCRRRERPVSWAGLDDGD